MILSGANYLRLCLALTILPVLAVGAFNYWADPCGIYHYNQPWDWIKSRPAIQSTEFIHKARAIESAQADVLLLGSSRTAEGLDPHSPALPPRAYNLGFPDSGMYEAWRYLQHACAAHTPKVVVLGVDIDGFSPLRRPNGTFSEDRLLVQADGQPTSSWSRTFADMAPTLFSLSTADLSLDTLRAPKGSPITFESGYQENAPQVLSRLDLASNVLAANQKFVEFAATVPYRTPDGKTPQMDAFAHIVALCADKSIRLIVFVQPLHSASVDRYTANWGAYSDWMKALAEQMESMPGLQGEFWDFAGYNSMNTEPFPLPTDKYSHMRYYWEGSHYRKVVGDLLLQRIFTGTGPANFGQLVTTATVDQDLQRLQDEKKAWHEHGQAVPINVDAPPASGTK